MCVCVCVCVHTTKLTLYTMKTKRQHADAKISASYACINMSCTDLGGNIGDSVVGALANPKERLIFAVEYIIECVRVKVRE